MNSIGPRDPVTVFDDVTIFNGDWESGPESSGTVQVWVTLTDGADPPTTQDVLATFTDQQQPTNPPVNALTLNRLGNVQYAGVSGFTFESVTLYVVQGNAAPGAAPPSTCLGQATWIASGHEGMSPEGNATFLVVCMSGQTHWYVGNSAFPGAVGTVTDLTGGM